MKKGSERVIVNLGDRAAKQAVRSVLLSFCFQLKELETVRKKYLKCREK